MPTMTRSPRHSCKTATTSARQTDRCSPNAGSWHRVGRSPARSRAPRRTQPRPGRKRSRSSTALIAASVGAVCLRLTHAALSSRSPSITLSPCLACSRRTNARTRRISTHASWAAISASYAACSVASNRASVTSSGTCGGLPNRSQSLLVEDEAGERVDAAVDGCSHLPDPLVKRTRHAACLSDHGVFVTRSNVRNNPKRSTANPSSARKRGSRNGSRSNCPRSYIW
jgi:hypothetical protein